MAPGFFNIINHTKPPRTLCRHRPGDRAKPPGQANTSETTSHETCCPLGRVPQGLVTEMLKAAHPRFTHAAPSLVILTGSSPSPHLPLPLMVSPSGLERDTFTRDTLEILQEEPARALTECNSHFLLCYGNSRPYCLLFKPTQRPPC